MAMEEYFLKNFTENVFILWRNEPAIIVGKHQNSLAEINLDFVKEKGIKVVRRLSGGGAVFHDLGNINFTFIENGSKPDFQKFTQPILDVLINLGIDACFEGRNDLTIGGRKFSGNAIAVWKNRTLEHGTLLFSSEMADLSEALKVNPLKFEDKSVKSTRSRVTNISEHLRQDITVTQFLDKVMTHVMSLYPDSYLYEYIQKDLHEIERLRDAKYSTWEWNFGSSPNYSFSKMVRTSGGNVEFHIQIEKGMIEQIRIFGDFFANKDIKELEDLLRNSKHNISDIRDKLLNIELNDYIAGAKAGELLAGMF
jgi:lipoate-protein ligase A